MDELLRGVAEDESLRVVVATTTEVVREAARRHELGAVEAAVLGRALTAGCLLSTLTKLPDERVRLQLDGGGPVGRILVDVLGDGSVRGCLQRRLAADAGWESFAGRPLLGDFVGRTGVVVVTRDLGLQQQYQGTIAVTSGEIDVDLERYLLHSEQIPSVLVCEVLVDGAGRVARAAGVLVQTFPGADPAMLLPARAALQAGALYALLGQPRAAEDLMGAALAGAAGRTLARSQPHFACTCGRERALSILSTLGVQELESLATEPGPTEVRCSFCGEAWNVTEAELRDLAARLRRERS